MKNNFRLPHNWFIIHCVNYTKYMIHFGLVIFSLNMDTISILLSIKIIIVLLYTLIKNNISYKPSCVVMSAFYILSK